MPRAIWKGAISFGLVHVPVALYPASQETGIDFDWVDKRSMDPVGYKRINKRTGKEISKENIVKGVKVEDGDYVVSSDDEIKATPTRRPRRLSRSRPSSTRRRFPSSTSSGPTTSSPTPRATRSTRCCARRCGRRRRRHRARGMHTKEHLAALIATDRGADAQHAALAARDQVVDGAEAFPPPGDSA